jgi:antitoxin FitA
MRGVSCPASNGLIAFCGLRCDSERMSVRITIRDVPDAVQNELAARAALQGKSMPEYLSIEMERLAARPPIDAVMARIRGRKSRTRRRIDPRSILSERDRARR